MKSSENRLEYQYAKLCTNYYSHIIAHHYVPGNHSDISTTAWGSPWQFRQNLPQDTCQHSTTNDRQCVQDIDELRENQTSKEHIANKALMYQIEDWPEIVLILTLPKFCLAPFKVRE